MLDPASHVYSVEGQTYRSVSGLLARVTPPFDPDGKIAERCAARAGISVADLRAEWQAKCARACDKGHTLHEALQAWVERGEVVPGYERSLEQFRRWPWRGPLASEVVLWNHAWALAGTTDLAERTGERAVRLYDFKTNEKLEKFCRWGRFLLPPVDHLEDCNFQKYELQLSLYGLMLERMGWTVERLTLFHIDQEQTWKSHRCRFLREECEAILLRHPATKRNEHANTRKTPVVAAHAA